jgi:hypothetical protein
VQWSDGKLCVLSLDSAAPRQKAIHNRHCCNKWKQLLTSEDPHIDVVNRFTDNVENAFD